MVTTPLRIVIVDDNLHYRNTISNFLQKKNNFQVVAEAGDKLAAIQAVEKHRPDVVLMDVSMPVMNGIDATHIITTKFPDTKVIVLTMHTDECYLNSSYQAGACGFLPKDCGKKDLLNAIKECSPAPSRVVGNPLH